MKLKVCGVSDAEFALEAARLGVDYLGFIFEPSSPRFVTVEAAAKIAAALSAAECRARLVGVFVSQTVDEIVSVMREARLGVVQLHRRATENDVAALRAAGFEVWTLAGGALGDGAIFDSSHGDGEKMFSRLPCKTILAGGIGIDNLAEAVSLGPDVIDVNSSVEATLGKKSIDLLKEFMAVYAAHIAHGTAICYTTKSWKAQSNVLVNPARPSGNAAVRLFPAK